MSGSPSLGGRSKVPGYNLCGPVISTSTSALVERLEAPHSRAFPQVNRHSAAPADFGAQVMCSLSMQGARQGMDGKRGGGERPSSRFDAVACKVRRYKGMGCWKQTPVAVSGRTTGTGGMDGLLGQADEMSQMHTGGASRFD